MDSFAKVFIRDGQLNSGWRRRDEEPALDRTSPCYMACPIHVKARAAQSCRGLFAQGQEVAPFALIPGGLWIKPA